MRASLVDFSCLCSKNEDFKTYCILKVKVKINSTKTSTKKKYKVLIRLLDPTYLALKKGQFYTMAYI